jgi:hypothetical protein
LHAHCVHEPAICPSYAEIGWPLATLLLIVACDVLNAVPFASGARVVCDGGSIKGDGACAFRL